MTTHPVIPILVGAYLALLAMFVWGGIKYADAADQRADLVHVIDIQGHTIQQIQDKCAVNRLDGSATCPVGTFLTVRTGS